MNIYFKAFLFLFVGKSFPLGIPLPFYDHYSSKAFNEFKVFDQSLSLFSHDIIFSSKTQNHTYYENGNNQISRSSAFYQTSGFFLQSYSFLKNEKNFFFYILPRVYKNRGRTDAYSNPYSEYGTEIIKSGFGFKNEWLELKICKDNESWAAGDDIELALNKKSEPYDYLSISSSYGKISVKYIHGFLDKVNSNINRFIVARGIEWSNKSNFIFGLSETIVYSGQNRSMDIGYLNPIASHLEVELNNRLNKYGDSFANAVWQLHTEFLFNSKLRISFNYLFDEFVIDPDIEKNKEHGKGSSLKVLYSPFSLDNQFFSIFLSYIKIGTPTFRHGVGYNNFVNRGYPLGWYRGSDCNNIIFGFNYLVLNRFFTTLSYSLIYAGEENILNRSMDPYKDYKVGKFPSGVIKKEQELDLIINWKYENNITYILHINGMQKNKNNYDFKVLVGIEAPFRMPKKLND